MIPLLVSIILGFLCFIFVANLYQVRLPRAPEIEKRLESIKKAMMNQIMPLFQTL